MTERNALWDAAKREGYWSAGRAPYGYDRAGRPPRGSLVPNGDAPVVRGIFLTLAGGATSSEVAARLRQAAAPSPSERARAQRQAPWTATAVQTIARNPAYCGLVPLAKGFSAARWESLISEDLWEQAQASDRSRDRLVRKGQDRAALQRSAFEEGYWHHQRVPRGCIRVSGKWPRYVLGPGPDFPEIRDIIERVAAGEDLASVALAARDIFPEVATCWVEPAEGIIRSIRRHALHPALGGFTVWGNRTSLAEVTDARWAPFLPRPVWLRANLRLRRSGFR